MKRKCATGLDLEKALADGEVTQQDADEIEQFAEFLRRCAGKSDVQKHVLYREMYPPEESR
jgi:hypothetical protein